MLGRSRSVSAVIAYLIKFCNKTCKESLSLVKKSRPIVNPNIGFIDQLEKYERITKWRCFLSGLIPEFCLVVDYLGSPYRCKKFHST